MQQCLNEFVLRRIEDIEGTLFKKDAEYAKAVHSSQRHLEKVEEALLHSKEAEDGKGAKHEFDEYWNSEFEQRALLMEAVYRQGYLDCVALLKTLGILK